MKTETPRTDAAIANAPAECWTAAAMGIARELERENARLREALAEAQLLLDHERRLGGMRCFASRALIVLSSVLPNTMMSQPGK